MSHVEAVQRALISHLCEHVPAVERRVSLAPGSQPRVTLTPIGNATKEATNTPGMWLHGPSWRSNAWAGRVPDPVARRGNTFTRFHAPPACDLLYDVLVISRCPRREMETAVQLHACFAHHGEIRAPLDPGAPMSAANTAVYELRWDDQTITRNLVNTSGLRALAGRLCIEGVLIDSHAVAERGRIVQQSPKVHVANRRSGES